MTGSTKSENVLLAVPAERLGAVSGLTWPYFLIVLRAGLGMIGNTPA